MFEAQSKKQECNYRVAAWHVAHVINLVRKPGTSGITPDELLGESRKIEGARGIAKLTRDATAKYLGIDPEEIDDVDDGANGIEGIG